MVASVVAFGVPDGGGCDGGVGGVVAVELVLVSSVVAFALTPQLVELAGLWSQAQIQLALLRTGVSVCDYHRV